MTSFTEADVQLVAEALSGPRWREVVPIARVAVAALADAGRLTPDGAEQPRTKIVRTWYRSLLPDGTIWCESSNGREVLERSEGVEARYERRVIAEVSGMWEPWVEADGTP